jgi:single-strand DNA-binding protein
MIKLTAIGNLGKDAVLNNVNGKNVINFNVAHTESYKDKDGNKVDKTVWMDCSYWSERTGIAPYLKKGIKVYIEGQPEAKSFTTKDGVNGATLSVRVGLVQLLSSKSESDTQPQTAAPSNEDDSMGLPF